MFFDWFVYEMFTKKEKCKEEKWKLLRILSVSISCPLAALVCVKWTLSYQHSSFCVLELWVQNSGSVKASEAFSKNPVLENNSVGGRMVLKRPEKLWGWLRGTLKLVAYWVVSFVVVSWVVCCFFQVERSGNEMAPVSFQGWREEQIFFFPHVLWIRHSKACEVFLSEGQYQSFEN